ncbi:bleomycin resistance protein [Sphingomonas sp. Leaf67]|uniref:VOC family protein n=1 Tax=unclassified Sphingomonas TaxID=196159 RepID=UPI000700F852|nr:MULTISPECIES: VOC family protein [unclassified Sphingomonas]KQN70904.1 bleomycin resistance protein [Sphingomonas sp. Leaf62]KQN83784.1 bleomycin resistance protein [Sphingomonas sp. Leaf67]
MARLNYLELPVAETGPAADFYAKVMGWTFTAYGTDYAATTTGDTDLGLDADTRLTVMLPVIQVEDLEATLAAVEAAGGTVVEPIFAFPGGRRFHFRDPDGHVLAAMVPE